ncbi:hydantoinase B/oxoprolinase family protein [Lentibacillus jeotgali]|uniref:hydantoinase B/oxoprolinase family protein n=1 Tax=Lentibacillus jeotgali TaxID=558169 RepID=UPI0002627C7F|nr:hydantoinase B/oxoprolinase family protein [Lentibacillus jeotgali]
MSKQTVDAITIEVMKNAFQSIAEEMGATLIRTALSPNIKDRMDCSTAIYTNEGKLIAQAEHIPLHLGLMPSVVEEVLKIYPPKDLKPGDAILINDPYISGSHLPDVFLVSPVFYANELVAITANIAHHVDVGGMTPGSMSVKATEIFQEGLRLPAVRISKEGSIDDEVFRLIKTNVRTDVEVEGDLYAQMAANNVGANRLSDLFDRYGVPYLQMCMEEIMNYSDRRIRSAISQVPDGSYTFEDYLEGDGVNEAFIKISTQVDVIEDSVVVDFTGSAPQAEGPVNSTIGVTKACVYYAIKSLVDPEVPPNDGTYRSIDVKAPKGTIVNPGFPASVSNANLNTSQRITDTILGALASVLPERSAAASSGTMNGLAIGGLTKNGNGENAYFSYVETYGGGQGATDGLDGMDGVHTNMTNTLNTPVEVIETSYPLLVRAYGLVDGSGGSGEYRGGMGLMREIEINCERATLTLMSERQKIRPWGLFGGKEGAPSSCFITYPNGESKEVSSKVTLTLEKGTVISFRSAGGGGYGYASKRDKDMIKKDVEIEKITAEEALNDYGIAVDI